LADDTLQSLSDSLSSGECLLLVLSRKRRGPKDSFTKVSVRPVVVQKKPAYQFTFHFSDRVTHENCEPAAAARRAVRLLEKSFEDAALYTSRADYAFRAAGDGSFRCKSGPPTKTQAPAPAHNRSKARLIPEGVPCPFLVEIGIMTPEGHVRSSMTHKFRQINRFLELVDDIVPSLETEKTLRVVDFGCGKSYLTFALHHLLTEIHGRAVQIVGLDRKSDVVRHCADLAGRLNCMGLEFREGDIADHEESNPVDLAVSLHACDMATDDALAQAIRWKSKVILAVPCCQHELAQKIDGREIAPLIGHGILRERFAAIATDALRSLVLEIAGYATQVVEFIDMEHTAKNILIRAVRRNHRDARQRAVHCEEYQSLKRLLGINAPAIERALGPELFQ
jgi:SAM-dependent methyltransferase